MVLKPRIIAAIVLGLTLVGASFILRPDPTEQNVTLAKKEEGGPIRDFIVVKDSDDNGIPDWQESFAKEPIEIDANSSVSTTTRTGQLVSNLASYLMSKPGNPELAVSLFSRELATEILDEQYEETDIKTILDNGPAALRAYGNRVAEIAGGYTLPAGTEDEMTILNRSFVRSDEKILIELDPIIAAYKGMRDDMLALPVPSSLTREHLSLINVYNALYIDLTAFRGVYDDALTAMLRFRRYPADAAALYTAISNLYLKLHESGIQWNESDPASKFIRIES